MDSWTLQGDSYSFLRSAPRTFSLRHRDGTPNHVEIFDITNITSHRSAISETTCLCDIFSDDCEAPSLSSSPPSSGSLVPPVQKEADGRAAASPPADDLNDSSGSYHTAPCSIEGEELFEDSTERSHSTTLQRDHLEGPGLSSPNQNTVDPSAKAHSPPCGDRTPSPEHNISHTLSPEGRASSLSTSSVDTKRSSSSSHPKQDYLEAESRSITPGSQDRHSSFSYQSSTLSPSPELRNRANSSSSSELPPSSSESRGAAISPEPRSISGNRERSPSPELISSSYSPDLLSTTFAPRVLISSHSPSHSSAGISSQSRETSVSPDLKNRSCSPDTQHSSPYPELRGRISLPDLFSRGSTPDIEHSPCTPELIHYSHSPARRETTPASEPENKLSAEPSSTVSTPAPQYTPPSPLISQPSTPELSQPRFTPESKLAPPSPDLLSATPPLENQIRRLSPARSPEIRLTPPSPESRIQGASPLAGYKSAQSSEAGSNYSPVERQHPAASPEIRIITPSPEVRRRETSTEAKETSNSPHHHRDSISPGTRSVNSSPPQITGICYSIVQPEDLDSAPFPELPPRSTPECGQIHQPPAQRSRHSSQSSPTESSGTPGGSPQIAGVTCTVLQCENTERELSPQPRYKTTTPEPNQQTPSLEPKPNSPSPEPRYPTPSSDRCKSSSPQRGKQESSPLPSSPEPRFIQLSPVAASPEHRINQQSPIAPSLEARSGHLSPVPSLTEHRFSPQSPTTLSPEPRFGQLLTEHRFSPQSATALSPEPRPEQLLTEHRFSPQSPAALSPEPRSAELLTEHRFSQQLPAALSPEPRPGELLTEHRFSPQSPAGLSPKPRPGGLLTEHRFSPQSPAALSPEPRAGELLTEHRFSQQSPAALSPEPRPGQLLTEQRFSQQSPADRFSHQSPTALSPEPRFAQLSPVAPSPERRFSPQSPGGLPPEPSCNFIQPAFPLSKTDYQYTHLSVPLNDIPEVEESVSPFDKHSPHSASPNKLSAVANIENGPSAVKSPIQLIEVCDLPFSDTARGIEQSIDSEITLNEIYQRYNPNSEIVPAVVHTEDSFHLPPEVRKDNSPTKQKPTSPNRPFSLGGRSPNNSPAHTTKAKSPLQRAEVVQPTYPTHSAKTVNRENSIHSPEHTGRELSHPKTFAGTRERLTVDMANRINRRRTPSPPLTRFTPVHIIAPEKPYRHWQNRNHSSSPPQDLASQPAVNVKKQVPTTRGNSKVALGDSNSQAHWVRREREMEMEREEEEEEEEEREREKERERQKRRRREMERERKEREELLSEQGEGGRRGDTSYRGEQVELSFSARNRKGPIGAPTSTETRQRVPTARSYSESLFAARHIQQQQQQQQQSLLHAQASQQQDSRQVCGGPVRRQYPALPQSKIAAPPRRAAAANRPSQSSSSSMGSELDDADNEVQWFSDLAFSSLSSPEVDYLDMYNSSHRSSTNASQPSTQDSPAGVNAAWLAYAEFKGSAPRLDNEDFLFQQPCGYYSDGLDPSRRYEMGSFECVDVAVEREEPRKGKRCVPKRQIQLKRKTAAEMMQDESSENSSPLITDSPLQQRRSKDTFVRQHSTPAAMEESYRPEPSPEPVKNNERKPKLQKSASLDDTGSGKTTMATCLIKSVLSKKMRSVDKQAEEQEMLAGVGPASEDKTLPPPQCAVAPLRESPKTDERRLSSSLRSDQSLSPEVLLPLGRDPSPAQSEGRQQKPGKFSNRPSPNNNFTLSESDREWSDSQRRQTTPSGASEMRSEFTVPFDDKAPTPENIIPGIGGERGGDASKGWEERQAGDSANATARVTGSRLATRACSAEARTTDSEQECEGAGTEDLHGQLQQCDNGMYMSNTPEIIQFKASSSRENKKKTSLSVSLSPDLENRVELHREAPSPDLLPCKERLESRGEKSEEVAEDNGNNRAKAPMHKVRDVRKLVKNTYNLSFKAASSTLPSFVSDDEKREAMEERRVETKEERKQEKTEERREASSEVRTQQMREEMAEQRMEERGEELRGERREGRRTEVKLPPPVSPSLQRKATSLSRPQQPMQIECKAVCLKEDKNKTTPSTAESEKTREELHASPLPPADMQQESHTRPEDVVKRVQTEPTPPGPKAETETQSVEVKAHKTTDDEVKSEVVRRDKKPPMLGSLPKVPSKDREVSTAVVLIRDVSSKTKTSPSPAQDDIQSPLRTQSVSPSRPMSSMSPGSGGHAVSMILKEKGYQADIGAVVGEAQATSGAKGVPHKHVNRLEIPLQTNTPSDGGQGEPRRERTFSSSSTKSGPPADTGETPSKVKEEDDKSISKDAAKQNSSLSTVRHVQQQHQTPSQTKQKEPLDFEAVKRQDPTFPPKSPAPRRFRPQPIEVKSTTKEPQQPEVPGSNQVPGSRPQTIEVRSIANNSQKPVVPPKPNYKFKPADFGPQSNETQKSTEGTPGAKPLAEDRSQTIVVSSPTIYRKLSNETTSASNYTRKLAVSAVSSYKPPPGKTSATISGPPSRSTALPETEATTDDRVQQQQPGTSPQSSRYTQRPTTLATAQISAAGPGVTSAPGPINAALATNQVPGPSTFHGPASAVPSQSNQPPAVVDQNSQPQQHRRTTAYTQEQAMTVTSSNSAKQSTTQVPGYTHAPPRQQQYHRSLSSGERSQRMDDMHFYASDDPPSYDERESFSPLVLPDLTARKPHRYHPSSRPPPCSCTSGCPSHPGLTPPSQSHHQHHHHSPRNLTPPAPSHSPGQALTSYPMAVQQQQPHPSRGHAHCRSDPLPMSYPHISPKSSPMAPPSQPPPAMYQPQLHQPPVCPAPHPSLMQPAPQQMQDPRRPPVHRSPHQQPPPGVGPPGGPYGDHSHSHSPNLPPMDAQYLCGPQGMGPSYGSDYGGDNSSLYSESSYGQTAPRRVLMDPETGKYFYIEVPVQPLRKMLFDPETGQYVEVLIPQQAMSHSGLYPPPSAAPYPSLHNPNMYTTSPQYMPYGAPPHPQHPQAQPQPPPRHPEASAPPGPLHQSGPGSSYGSNPGPGQGPKPEPHQGHPPLDQSYLESMYYVPTGMNASPNPADCYHKHPPGQPNNAGGKRS